MEQDRPRSQIFIATAAAMPAWSRNVSAATAGASSWNLRRGSEEDCSEAGPQRREGGSNCGRWHGAEAYLAHAAGY
jgi:hypothetical protein